MTVDDDRLERIRRLLPDSWRALGMELHEGDPAGDDGDPVDDFDEADTLDGQGPGNRGRRDDARPAGKVASECVR